MPAHCVPLVNGTTGLNWQKVRHRKRTDREQALARYPDWHLRRPVEPTINDVSKLWMEELCPRECEILANDATSLLEHIRLRKYTALEVTMATLHAACIAQGLTNCLTEIFFEDGLLRAKELDDYMERTGQVVGPLHGLPVSVKDHIKVKGKDTATGYIAWCYKTVADQDAVAVAILRKAGAVLFVKTNNPQTLLSLETDNNIYGYTPNPYNRNLTAGGSSGGESALIALHGSFLGIGTDIGGSIRAPAVHAGLYGFKASVARMPHSGLLGSHDGMDAIVGVLGPLTRSARDLSLFCRVMHEYEPWLLEPPLLEIPWKQEIVNGKDLPQKLSIAILWDDGVVAPHPPITRALADLKDKLGALGHEVIDWQPIDHIEAWDLITKLYFLDGGEEYRQVLKESGEPAVPQTEWIMSHIPNDGQPFTVPEIFRLNLEREAFRGKLLNHWNMTQERTSTGRPVDAILCPVAPTLAPPHNSTRWWGYTSYWNLADYPAATFPIGHFSADAPMPTFSCREPVNDIDKFIRSQWNDPAQYDNAPIGLQVVGRRLNEEKVLAILDVIEKALGK